VWIGVQDGQGSESATNDDTITFIVGRWGYWDSSLSVQLFAPAGTATAGDDYTGMPTTVVIPGNDQPTATTTFELTPADDELFEEEESVYAILKASGDYWLSSAYMAWATIGDNDVDVDVDSDNNNGFNSPGRTEQEEQIEDDSSKPGKIIAVNDDDNDADSVPDFADFDGISGERFVPMVIELPEHVDVNVAKLKISYDDSVPDAVTGSGTAEDPYVPGPGMLRVWKKNGDAARNGATISAGGDWWQDGGSYSLSELGGSGRTVTVWLEAVRPSAAVGDQRIQVSLAHDGTNFVSTDAVRVTTVAVNVAVDNDRDGMIELDGQDGTSPDKPFLFWLNDNRDVWGGDDYQAAVAAPPGGLTDAQLPKIGSAVDSSGASILGNDAALREVARRDLEDFAQVGLSWPAILEPQITDFRIRLESAAGQHMAIRVFASARQGGLEGNVFSATSAVYDEQSMNSILSWNYWGGTPDDAQGRVAGKRLGAGESYSWKPGITDLGIGVTDGAGGVRLLQLMFEGVRAGSGKLVFELLRNGQVLASSSTDLRLRPIQELYDHYSVAYGPNVVMPDRTFKDTTDFDPLDLTNPVPTTAMLLDENRERDRFQQQSDDYFVFVHGWRMKNWERVAFAESAYKRMYWSGYRGQFGLFSWPTLHVDEPIRDAGNFDRSEFVAWNSAAGLVNALRDIRAEKMPAFGTLSAMAHSMGNIVLSEALYQTQNNPGDLVDNAILSQAAISSHYYSSDTSWLPDIYKPHQIDPATGIDVVQNHISARTTAHAGWTEYKGFRPYGQDLDVIGGATPRFAGIAAAAGTILNYYNPDDYALATWRYDQVFKPTSEWSGPITALTVKGWVDLGNVDVESSWSDAVKWFFGEDKPGFADTEYGIESRGGGEYKIVRRYTGAVNHPDVDLSYATNKYEMFAFGASSLVASVGGVNSLAGLEGVFDPTDSANLNQIFGANSKFNNLNTGHSAQFVHSFRDVAGYWQKLKEDIQ